MSAQARFPHAAAVACAAGAAALLGACSLAPSYQRPAVAQPQAFREMPAGWKAAEPADALPRGAWWRRYDDTALDALEQRVTLANEDLKAGVARLDQARAAATIAKAPSLPLLNLAATARRARVSETTANHAAGSAALTNDTLIGLNLSYEIDLWGRVRNAGLAAEARAEASAADLEALRLSLHAELANDYFAMRGYEQMEQLLNETLASSARALDLTRHRHAAGLVTEQDVNLLEVLVGNMHAARADVQLRRTQLVHAMALLVGAAASDFDLAGGRLPSTPAPVQPGLPASLLERRPDVAAAERRVFAANADIGVARAAYFPTLGIGAAAGHESARKSALFDTPSRFWSLGPQAALNLFDAGRSAGTVDLARGGVDEAAANYRRVVLTAYKEAEDSLAAIGRIDEELAGAGVAAAAAERTLAQVRRQYDGGLVSFLPVASAQLAALQTRQALVSLRVARLDADVMLVRALGGDWRHAAGARAMTLKPEKP